MCLKEILNEADLCFLKELAHELKIQDRRGTSKPVIYNILDINIRWDNDYFDGFDTVRVYDNEGNCLETLDEMKDYIIENLEEMGLEEEKETIKSYGIDEIIEIYKAAKYHVSFGHYERELKNAFLTMKSAEEHLKENSHHYHEKAHVYVSYGWRNPELEKLLNIIEKFDMEEKENEKI